MTLETAKYAMAISEAILSDAALPALTLLSRPAELVAILSSLLVKRLRAKRRVVDSCVKVLRYVPGKRCIVVFELTIESEESSATESQNLIGKFYANDHGQKVFATLQELQSFGFADSRLAVSEPLAYDPHWQLLLLDHSKGELLRNLILAQVDVDGALEGTAEWLVKLHRCRITSGRRYSLQDHLRTLEGRKNALEHVSPDAARSFEEVLARIGSQVEKIEKWRLGPTHRDFSPDHLLVDGAHFTGLDFDEFCQYDPVFDVAHFIAHVGYLGVLHSGSLHRFDPLAKRFSAAYQSFAGIQSLVRLEPYLALAYLKLAHIVALVTRPANWQEMTDTILAEAQQFSQVK